MRGASVLLPVLLVIAAHPGSAQGTEKTPPKPDRDGPRRAGDRIDKEAARRARFFRRFRITVSTRPRILVPGERGTLYIMVRLIKGTVVVPNRDRSNVKLSYELGEMPLAVRQLPKVTPPTLSDLPGFAGKKLYDDLIVYELPVAVPAASSAGKHVLKGTMTLGIQTVSPMKDLGIVTREFEHEIRIGKPAQQPISNAGDGRPQDASGDPRAVRPRPDADPKSVPERTGDQADDAVDSSTPTKGVLDRPENAETPLDADELADPGDDVPLADSFSPLWILGGLACVVLLLLLAKRRG